MKWLVALALLFFAVPTFASVSIVGTYSSLYYNEESGDLLGHEITILRDPKGYSVKFQIAEGRPSNIVAVPIQINGTEFRFEISKSKEGGGAYSGKVTQAGLMMDDGGVEMAELLGRNIRQPFLLKRKCSYWRSCSSSRNRQR